MRRLRNVSFLCLIALTIIAARVSAEPDCQEDIGQYVCQTTAIGDCQERITACCGEDFGGSCNRWGEGVIMPPSCGTMSNYIQVWCEPIEGR